MFRFVTFTVNFAIFLVQFVLSMLSDKPSRFRFLEEDDVRKLPHSVFICEFVNAQQNPSPELTASFLSHLTWWWQNGYVLWWNYFVICQE